MHMQCNANHWLLFLIIRFVRENAIEWLAVCLKLDVLMLHNEVAFEVGGNHIEVCNLGSDV